MELQREVIYRGLCVPESGEADEFHSAVCVSVERNNVTTFSVPADFRTTESITLRFSHNFGHSVRHRKVVVERDYSAKF